MPYSYTDLTNAAKRMDVRALQDILRERDPETGRPLLDINNMPGDTATDRNLLCFILNRANPCHHEIDLTANSTRDMILSILAIRDRDGNPVVNINTVAGAGNILEKLFNQYRFLSESNGVYGYNANRQNFLIMMNALINLRNNAGEQLLDLRTVGNESPLLSAIRLGDADLVSMLLDLRNADDTFAIDVNLPYLSPISRTPLDAAHVGHTGREHCDRADFVPNARIVRMLQDRGAVRFNQLTAQQREGCQAEKDRMSNQIYERNYGIALQARAVRRQADVVRPPEAPMVRREERNAPHQRDEQQAGAANVARPLDIHHPPLLVMKQQFLVVIRKALIDQRLKGRLISQ